jgi:hypothetical protein
VKKKGLASLLSKGFKLTAANTLGKMMANPEENPDG